MLHPLIEQLHFTRNEWLRAFEGVTIEEAAREFGTMNTIGWMVGHLAWHEQLYWLQRAQGKMVSEAVLQCGSGQPRCTPPLDEMWQAWHAITAASEPYLDTITTDTLQEYLNIDGKPHLETIGTMLRRMTYHYWFHLGEGQAIRQLLGHTNLPSFVGNINAAPYRPE